MSPPLNCLEGAGVSDIDESGEWLVLVNDEQQYSLWPAARAIPAGWREAGARGSRSDCIAWVDRTWVDMTPASLRAATAAA